MKDTENGYYEKIMNEFAQNEDYSDLHIRSKEVVIFREKGQLVGDEEIIMSPNLVQSFIERMLFLKLGKEVSEQIIYNLKGGTKELDLSIVIPNTNMRARVNIFHSGGDLGLVMRKIPDYIPDLADLGFYPEHIDVIKRVANKKQGMILLTGQTGSGKSTTLASIINYINMTKRKHIITIEDPVEFYHKSDNSLITHREVGEFSDTKEFKDGLRASLRQDPDIILVGEIRDEITADIALRASQTGHIVLSTLHTNNAAETILRLIDMFPPEKSSSIRTSIATSIRLIISQSLVPTVEGDRVLAYELLENNSAIASIINRPEFKSSSINDTMNSAMSKGMITLNHCLKRRITEDNSDYKITKETAFEYSYNPDNLESLIKNIDGANSQRRKAEWE